MPESTPFTFVLGTFSYHTKQADKVDSLYYVHVSIADLLTKKSQAGKRGFSAKGKADFIKMIDDRINWLVRSVEIAADLGCSPAELRKLVAAITGASSNQAFRLSETPSWEPDKSASTEVVKFVAQLASGEYIAVGKSTRDLAKAWQFNSRPAAKAAIQRDEAYTILPIKVSTVVERL